MNVEILFCNIIDSFNFIAIATFSNSMLYSVYFLLFLSLYPSVVSLFSTTLSFSHFSVRWFKYWKTKPSRPWHDYYFEVLPSLLLSLCLSVKISHYYSTASSISPLLSFIQSFFLLPIWRISVPWNLGNH